MVYVSFVSFQFWIMNPLADALLGIWMDGSAVAHGWNYV